MDRALARDVIAEVKRLHGLSAEDAAKQANRGEYNDWMLADSQEPVAIRKVYEEIEGKLPPANGAPDGAARLPAAREEHGSGHDPDTE